MDETLRILEPYLMEHGFTVSPMVSGLICRVWLNDSTQHFAAYALIDSTNSPIVVVSRSLFVGTKFPNESKFDLHDPESLGALVEHIKRLLC